MARVASIEGNQAVSTYYPLYVDHDGSVQFAPVRPDQVETLSDILNVDSPPVRVNDDGSLSVREDVYAPDVFAADGADDETDLFTPARNAGWELLTGYTTGQYNYKGPVMSMDETLDGRLAEAMLSTPGVYAVASVNDVQDDGYPVGWVLMRKLGS